MTCTLVVGFDFDSEDLKTIVDQTCQKCLYFAVVIQNFALVP
jgi:hypothetical protein